MGPRGGQRAAPVVREARDDLGPADSVCINAHAVKKLHDLDRDSLAPLSRGATCLRHAQALRQQTGETGLGEVVRGDGAAATDPIARAPTGK